LTGNVPEQNQLAPGEYRVTVADGNGCESSGKYNITNPTAITADIESMINVTCAGNEDGRLTIQATGGTGDLAYSIDGGNSYRLTAVFDTLAAGDYTVMVKDSNDCEVSLDEVTLRSPSAIILDYDASAEASANMPSGDAEIIVKGGSGSYEYSVDGGNTWQDDKVFTDLSLKGFYDLVVQDQNGCQFDTTKDVVKELINMSNLTVQLAQIELNIPGLITPDGDGRFDTWEIPGLKKYPAAMVQVFNMHGKEVYRSRGYHEPWDGKVFGTTLPADIYIYRIIIDQENVFRGKVLLMR
jgi:gliding motility-associated-like protein